MRQIEYRWVILATAFLILFLGGGRLHLFGLLLKPMSEDLDVTRSSLSLVVLIFNVTSAISVLVVGRLLDRYSLKLIMGLGSILSAVGFILMGWVSEPWQLFVIYAFFIALAGPGVSLIAIGVMISQWFDRRHGAAMSVSQSGGSLGQMVILGALAIFLSELAWRTAFVLLGTAYLLLVPPLVFALVKTRPPTESVSPKAPGDVDPQLTLPSTKDTISNTGVTMGQLIRNVSRTREIYLLMAVYAICGFQDMFVTTHVVAFTTDQGISQQIAGNLLALMGIMSLAGVLSAGFLADSFGAVKATLLCFAMRIGIFAWIIYFQDPFSIAAFALLYGYTFPITAPLIIIFVRKIFGTAHLGIMTAFILVIHQIPGGLGAYTGALFFDKTGSYDGAFLLMLLLSGVALLVTTLIRESPLSKHRKLP